LTPASQILDIYECLGLKGEKYDILSKPFLLLAEGIIFIAAVWWPTFAIVNFRKIDTEF